jgi:hypothetical protein
MDEVNLDLLAHQLSGRSGLLPIKVLDTKWYAMAGYNTLSDAVLAIGSATRVLLITTTISVDASTTIPSNVTIWLAGEGSFSVSAGITLTLPSPAAIHAPGSRQIFSGSGTVSFTIGGTASPGWFGLATSASAATNAAAIEDCMNALPTANCGSLIFPGDSYSSGNVQISNRNNLTLNGNGSTINWSGTAAASNFIGFQLLNTCSQITVQNFHLVGDGTAASGHAGLWNASGQTISQTTVQSNHIEDCTVGISYNAASSGTHAGGVISQNYITNVVGTSSGQGYGIHLSSATNIRVFENWINLAQRHSIYHASGDSGCVIHDNIITNHRSGVSNDTYTCAISVSRSSNVTVSHNIVRDHYDGGIEVSHTTVDALNCSNIIVNGNQFIDRQNAVEDMLIGEQGVPTSYETYNVHVSNNLFTNAYADKSTSANIIVMNGRQLHISGNTFKTTGITGTARFITIGHNSHISSDSHCTETHLLNNVIVVEGNTLTDVRCLEYCTDILTNTSRHVSKGSSVPTGALRWYDGTTRTNPNIRTDSSTGHFMGLYTAADTTPSVYQVTCMYIANAGGVTITQFDDGEEGQVLTLIFADTNTTVSDGANIQLASSTNFTSAGNATLVLVKRSTQWFQIGGSTN